MSRQICCGPMENKMVNVSIKEFLYNGVLTVCLLALSLSNTMLFSISAHSLSGRNSVHRCRGTRHPKKWIALYKSSGKAFDMAAWLWDLRGLQCWDPRDRIYSFLGLLHSHRRQRPISMQGRHQTHVSCKRWAIAPKVLGRPVSSART